MTIDSVQKITTGQWVVKYSTRYGCCGLNVDSLIINSVDKPTQKQIENAIRNIRK